MTPDQELIKTAWLLLMLTVGSFFDIRDKSVSVGFLLLTAAGCILLSVPCFEPVSFFTGLLPGLFLLLFSFHSAGAIGEADAYAICFIGMTLGLYASLSILMIALLLMSISAQILFILKKAGRRSRIPLYPYLDTAFIIRLIILKGGN